MHLQMLNMIIQTGKQFFFQGMTVNKQSSKQHNIQSKQSYNKTVSAEADKEREAMNKY